MILAADLNPKKVCYIFSAYDGPLIAKAAVAIGEVCPGKSLIFISYKNLTAADSLTVRHYSEGAEKSIQCTIDDLLKSMQSVYLKAVTDNRERVLFSIPCDVSIIFMPGWFNYMLHDEADMCRHLKTLFALQSNPAPLHPAHEKTDERVFHYSNLHKFDDLLGFVTGLKEYSIENIVYALRSFERVHR